MTLSKLLMIVALIAVAIFFFFLFTQKAKIKVALISYLQIFCGVLFLVSGGVKAIDPLGTAFKLHQYFAEFQQVCSGSSLQFMEGIFPYLDQYATGLSVGTIVVELIIGFCLIFGITNRLTSWIFFGLIVFFTILTGFTYLTGYVPSSETLADGTTRSINFFEYDKWGAYNKNNMKVTDCGCFGDFLKLEPKVSFLKDVFLLIPAFIFLFFNKAMHRIIYSSVKEITLVVIATIGLIIFCLSNFVWNLPIIDFRPFYEGANIRKVKQEEQMKLSNAPLYFVCTNKKTGEVKTFSSKQLPNHNEWTYGERIQEEVEVSKVSDFIIDGPEGDMTDEILNHKGYTFMVVAYKLDEKGRTTENIPVTKKIVKLDTLRSIDSLTLLENIQIVTKESHITVQEKAEKILWVPSLINALTKLNDKVLVDAAKDKHKILGVTRNINLSDLESLRHEAQTAYPFYTADELLLKTMIRSSPGLVLWKDGVIVKKWHYHQLPTYEEIKNSYLR